MGVSWAKMSSAKIDKAVNGPVEIDASLLDQIYGGNATNTFPPSDKVTGSGLKDNGNGAQNNNEHVLKPNQIK